MATVGRNNKVVCGLVREMGPMKGEQACPPQTQQMTAQRDGWPAAPSDVEGRSESVFVSHMSP